MAKACAYKKVIRSFIVFLVLYVDDILIVNTCVPMLQFVKAWLSSSFSMKDVGET